MKLIEGLVRVLKKTAGVPREDIKKLDQPTAPVVNLDDDIATRSMLAKRPTIAYSGASRIYREQ